MRRGIVIVIVLAACVGPSADSRVDVSTTVGSTEVAPTTAVQTSTTSTQTTVVPSVSTTTMAVTTTSKPDGASTVRPDWLGTRVLPLRDDGFGVVEPTPPDLVDRRFPPSSFLRRGGDVFESTIGPVPSEVVDRSTWQEACPVTLESLAYLTMTFRGFDGESYVGEMIVDAAHAEGVVGVFRSMFEAGYPIEEMRVIASEELDLPPTGDGNLTSAFVCRPVTGGASWSQHAYGRAIDINPFHNPYVRGDLVLPELAGFYTDRELGLPGMIREGDVVVSGFDALGWGWGGRWTSLTDPQHFSVNGR